MGFIPQELRTGKLDLGATLYEHGILTSPHYHCYKDMADKPERQTSNYMLLRRVALTEKRERM